jgi:hypothetical protein
VLNFVLQYAGLVLALNELLETRFVPDNPSCSTPLGQSLRGQQDRIPCSAPENTERKGAGTSNALP